MNERILKLVEQATKQVTKPDGHYIVQEWQKVFAELIVQECAEWLKQPVNQTPLSGAVMNIAADRLKEHFGVEE